MEWLAHLKTSLFTPSGLQEMITAGGYVVLVGIVFAESGLMFGFFLPGDSLLFMAGFVASPAFGHLHLPLLIAMLSIAAIAGDNLGYWIGTRVGAAIYGWEDGRVFKRKHLQRTKEFYEKHGGKAIVMARFVPIVRAFTPVVAGVAQMRYARFLAFDIFGGVFWVSSMTLLGYFLGSVPVVQRNLEKAVLTVIFVSFLPILIETWRSRRRS